MSAIAAPKYLREIETNVAEKLSRIKSLNSNVLETQQLHYDSVLEIYQEGFKKLIDSTITYSKFLNEVKNAYDKAIELRDERISQFITQDKSKFIMGYLFALLSLKSVILKLLTKSYSPDNEELN